MNDFKEADESERISYKNTRIANQKLFKPYLPSNFHFPHKVHKQQ